MSGTWIAARTFQDEECVDIFEEDMRWFYLAESGEWRMFDENPSEKYNVTNGEIERNYCRNRNGVMEYSMDKCTCILNFSEMKQTNLNTGKEQPVKRQSTAGHSSLHSKPTHPVPSHWEEDLPFQLIPLDSSTKECQEVVKTFAESMPDVPIRSIMRVKNFKLWESFCRKKAQLTQIKQMPIEERMLFHGTAHKNIWSICASNFDLKFVGRHGSVHGKGIYFARHASYASKFCGVSTSHNGVLPAKTVILARVLVGEYTQGEGGLCQVPSKDKTMTSFYDSCIDDFNYPQTFLIFNSDQIYPEYLIQF